MVTRTLGGIFRKHDAVRSIEVRQAAEAFKARTRVTCRVVRTLDRSAASSSVYSIYKNQHPPLHFFYFMQKLHCQSESVTCQSFTRSHPPATTFIRSLFSSVSDSIRLLWYTFSFYTWHGKSFKFLASVSSFFILDSSVLGFVATL